MSGGGGYRSLPDPGTEELDVIVPKRVRSKTRKTLVDELEPPEMNISDLQMEDSLRQQGVTEEEIANMREMLRRKANQPQRIE